MIIHENGGEQERRSSCGWKAGGQKFNEGDQVLSTKSEGHWGFNDVEPAWKNKTKVVNTHDTHECEKWKWWQNRANTEQNDRNNEKKKFKI